MTRIAKFLPVMMCAMTLAWPGAAGTLRIVAPTVEETAVQVPVAIEGDVGDGVASLDFLLNYDPAVLEPVAVTAGNAANEAGKLVQGSMRGPGQYVVVMMGMNRNTVQQGEVVNITMRRVGGPDQQRSDISISRTTMASLEAAPIPSEGSTATVQLSTGTGEEDPEDEDEPDEETGDEETGPSEDSESPGEEASPDDAPDSATASRDQEEAAADSTGNIALPLGPEAFGLGDDIEDAGAAGQPAAADEEETGESGEESSSHTLDLRALAQARSLLEEARQGIRNPAEAGALPAGEGDAGGTMATTPRDNPNGEDAGTPHAATGVPSAVSLTAEEAGAPGEQGRASAGDSIPAPVTGAAVPSAAGKQSGNRGLIALVVLALFAVGASAFFLLRARLLR